MLFLNNPSFFIKGLGNLEKKESLSKKMANLLAQGAAMLDLSCPACDSILFRLKSQMVYCPNCNVEVKVFKKDEEIPKELREYQDKQQELIKLREEGKITEKEFQERLSKLKFPKKIENKEEVLDSKNSESTEESSNLSELKDSKYKLKKTINNPKMENITKISRNQMELETDDYLESDLKHIIMERVFDMLENLKNETQLDNQSKIILNIEKLIDIIRKTEDLF